MTRIFHLIIPGLALLVTGCLSYSTIDIDVLEPAGVNIPVEIASVVIVDNAFPTHDSVIHTINMPDKKYQIDSIRVEDYGKRVVQALGEALESQQFFDSVHVAVESLNPPQTGKPLRPLSFFQIDSLSRRYNAQAVIALDHYKYNTTTNVMDLSDYYYVTLDARSKTYWKIYNSLNGELLDIHLQEDTIYWDSEGAGYTSLSGVPKMREVVKTMAEYSGQKYARYVAPAWSTVSRFYFKQGHPLFYKADEHVKRNRWDFALPVWYRVYEEAGGKQKARAAFNLALGQEVMGNFREAMAWAYRSWEHYKELGTFSASEREENAAKNYYVELSRRLQEKKRLDDQFGFDE